MPRVGCISGSGLSTADFNETLSRRFASKCGVPDARGCIPWLGTRTDKGYGTLRINSKGPKSTAHRIAWALKNGDIPPELCVLHHCDNPSCVNADHLFLGSPLENSRDMVRKGRHVWRSMLPWQKLMSVDGERIKDLRAAGSTQQEIADWLGVSRPLISLIENGLIKHSQYAFSAA